MTQEWYNKFISEGGEDKRYDYKLDSDSLVFDVGGYQGDFAQRIYDTYKCWVFIFEPVPTFYDSIVARFANNKKVKVFPFGVSNITTKLYMSLDGDKSSLYGGDKNVISVNVKSMADVLADEGLCQVDLLKINIEGDEYPLLRHMLDDDLVKTFDNVQIQFHDFVMYADAQRKAITTRLHKTHDIQWCYDFVWESWRLR